MAQIYLEQFLSRFSKINALAVPFLSDAGTGEDDYALLPPPKPIKALQLTGIVFFAVSGSAYGIEETVSAGGPLLALLGLLLATTVWSAPLALISCELSVAMPHSGGYIVWVNSAFGPLASLLNGVANFLCNIFDCALYPLLLTDYLQRALLPILPPEPHGGGPGSWWRLAPDILGTALRLLLVLLAAAANVSGANVVGIAAGLLMLAVTLPFAWLTVAAYSAPNASVWAPLTPSLQNWPTSYAQGYFLCNLILWNTCGYDSAGMVAAEVVDGRKTFPRALAAALGLTTLLYLLPLAACTAADRRWAMWGEGQFEMLGIEFGGPVLGGALLCASIVSMVGVMCTLMMTSSRAIAAMAVLRMLPAPLARLHPITGAPHLSVVLNASLIAVATCTLRFEALLELSMFFYSINAIMQCASLHRLRRTHPHRLRPRHTLPERFLWLPASIAATCLLLSPWRNWVAAGSVVGCTLLAYGFIHLARLTQGHSPGEPPSARAVAAAEALRVVEPTEEQLAEQRREAAAQAQRASGDAWFASLVASASYARVSRTDSQIASEVVRAFEMEQLARDDDEEQNDDEEERPRAAIAAAADEEEDDDEVRVVARGNGRALVGDAPTAARSSGGGSRGGGTRLVAARVSAATASATVPPAPTTAPAPQMVASSAESQLLVAEGEEFVTEVSLDGDEIIE